MSELFILAGEASGDLHGAHLVQALRHSLPSLTAWGVCGPRLREQGVESLYGIEDFALMGFTDVICALPKLRRQLHHLTQAILLRKPPLVVLIDYAGFNMRLAARLRRAGFQGQLVQFIAPKVWAWGAHRVKRLAETLNLLLTIFPFEAAHFEGSGLRVEYVGNPLIHEKYNHRYTSDWKQKMGFAPHQPLIGIFPGSRRSEIMLNARTQLLAIRELQPRNLEPQFAISLANESLRSALEHAIQDTGFNIPIIPPASSYDFMANCHAALATSGTVNLELALHHVPHVVNYNVSHLNALIARCLFGVNLPHYSIANFVHEATFLPELIYTRFTPANAARALEELLHDTQKRHACLLGCEKVTQQLQTPEPHVRMVELLLPMLSQFN